MKPMWKKAIVLMLCFVLLISMSIPVFAGGSVSGSTAYISSGTKTVTSGDIPATITNRLAVNTVYVPNSVNSISSGAFTNLPNVKTIYVDNYEGGVNVSSGALPKGATIVYTGEKPTTTSTTRRTTTRTRTTTTTTTTTTSSTTESTTEAPSFSAVTKVATPIVTEEPTTTSVGVGKYISIAAVALAALLAVALAVLKFKK